MDNNEEHTMDPLEELFGAAPTSAEDVRKVLRIPPPVPIDPEDRKYALMVWLDRGGLKLERWMVEILEEQAGVGRI